MEEKQSDARGILKRVGLLSLVEQADELETEAMAKRAKKAGTKTKAPSKAGIVKAYLAENPKTEETAKEIAEKLAKQTSLAITANDVSMAKNAMKGSKGKGKAKKAKAKRGAPTFVPAPSPNGSISSLAIAAKALLEAAGGNYSEARTALEYANYFRIG